MNQSSLELDVVAAFRRQLAELPEPRPRPSGRRAAFGATVLATVALVMILAAADTPSDALAITRSPASLELRIVDASADAAQMTRELNDAGIRGRVLVVPVAPQDVGTWVARAEIADPAACLPSGDGRGPEMTSRLDVIQSAGSVLRLPVARVRESSGSFVLVAGRSALPDERAVALDTQRSVRDALERAIGAPAAALRAC